MAYNSNYNNRPAGGPSRSQGRPYTPTPAPEKKQASALPADYVDVAEEIMRRICAARSAITTSKIRNLLSLVSDLYNRENLRTEETLLPESMTGLTMMRIRVVYESGRDDATKRFVDEAKLLEHMKDIGTNRQKLIDFFHYMEALVAYHRYFGGKEV